jgi:hypothetical protein
MTLVNGFLVPFGVEEMAKKKGEVGSQSVLLHNDTS